MPANVDGMVREGISAFRAGRKDEARTLLMKAVEIDEHNEEAWLWLSAVMESPDEQRICLENVLAINPNNARAKQGLDVLDQKVSGGSPKASAAQADDLLANTSFTAQPAQRGARPAADEDELPPSLDLNMPVTATSSASANYHVAEPSGAEYDDWVSNLNLGKGGSSMFEDLPPATMEAASQFISTPSFDDDDDDFASFRNSAHTDIEEAEDEDLSGPFSMSEAPAAPAAAPKREPAASPAPKKSPAFSPKKSPGQEASHDLLDKLEKEADVDPDDYEGVEMEKMDVAEFFSFIPKDIAATRLPGTNEPYPVMMLLGLVLLIGLNIGAVAFLVMRLTAG